MGTGTNTDVIQKLSDHVVNLIAAGEVVERPASVVKELVENGIDAGATRIEVRLVDGGIQGVEVIDNGRGIRPGDLPLSVERHATSKVESIESLEGIRTLGFRGEALSSISSVGRVEIRSRRQGENCGFGIRIEFGNILGAAEMVGMPEGTVISVKDIFERVPARQKFLRSPQTELAHCQRVVREIALGNEGVEFRFSHNDSTPRSYVALERSARVKECLKVSWEPIVIGEEGDGIRLEAYLSPTHLYSDRGDLNLYVNRRPVKNRSLFAAIRRSYLDTVGPHHEPSGAVFLDIEPDWVDVNVHPQKSEVRILRGESLYSWISAAVRKAVAQRPHSVTEATLATKAIPVSPNPRPIDSTHQVREPSPRYAAFSDKGTLPSTIEAPPQSEFEIPSPQEVFSTRESRIRYLGQIRAAYLVCEDEEGILLVDQHALHEKFRFEELVEELRAGGLVSQRCLFPIPVNLPEELVSICESNRSVLGRLGMEVDLLASDTVAIRAMPSVLAESEAAEVLKEALRLSLVDSSEEQSVEQILRPYLATIACHSVVRANQRLSDLEASTLVGLLDRLELGWTCPHGRPVLFRMGFDEMERYFKRT